MRADVPQRSFLAPPRRLAERVPGPEDRAQPGRRRAVQLTGSPHVVDPTLYFRPEMRRMEDERGYLSAPNRFDDPVRRVARERQRLLEQQGPPGRRGTDGDIDLDVRRERHRYGVDALDEIADVG